MGWAHQIEWPLRHREGKRTALKCAYCWNPFRKSRLWWPSCEGKEVGSSLPSREQSRCYFQTHCILLCFQGSGTNHQSEAGLSASSTW